jgi:hypothetical protein
MTQSVEADGGARFAVENIGGIDEATVPFRRVSRFWWEKTRPTGRRFCSRSWPRWGARERR